MLTGSAAEILALALRELDQTTLMGERTSGGFPDIMGVKLHNGWVFGFSNQTYRSMDGDLF
ncbi:S41 family peptidase [Pacificibacter sp. AS14]|uniref:S41 family peptidase n=1 Tax=Pacificibacter sp. AS14 TaxID=3135785 RepID=UPI00317D2F81